MQAAPLADSQLEAYHTTMSHIALPNKGCFKAVYPSTAWEEDVCVNAPQHPYAPGADGTNGPRPAIVGNGVDYIAQVTSGHISSATGSFKSVTGVTSESDAGTNNRFSLQLNTDFFETPACNNAVEPSVCQGWEQFVYSNSGVAFIQYWLIGYGTSSKTVTWTCPSTWNTSGSDCWRNAVNSVSVPVQTIAQLAHLKLTGEASAGHSDTIVMTTSDGSVHASNNDSALDLAKEWQAAEFNLFGDCCSSQASVNGGMTAVVHLSVDNGTKDAPTCANGGFTGETNNLTLATTCGESGGDSPAIQFTESTPATSIWLSTGTACTGTSCPGWTKLDDNGDSVRIAGGAANFYQLHNTGKIWQYDGTPCSGTSCPGWKLLDDQPDTLQIAAAGTDLYQLLNTGVVLRYSGGSWDQIDSNSTIVTIAAAGTHVYELHASGHVFSYSGTNWKELDSNANPVEIAAEGNNLYEMHKNGEVWGYTPCTGSNCWKLLDNNSGTLHIIADGNGVYQLHTNGEIWHYTGTPCSSGTCKGWQMLDDNSQTGRIEAAGGDLYQMHIPLVLHSRTLTCYECR